VSVKRRGGRGRGGRGGGKEDKTYASFPILVLFKKRTVPLNESSVRKVLGCVNEEGSTTQDER